MRTRDKQPPKWNTDPSSVGLDFTDVRILDAIGAGKMSIEDICLWVGLVERGRGQFVTFRIKKMIGRGWILVDRMPGKGNGSRRMRTLTRGGRMALKRFRGALGV